MSNAITSSALVSIVTVIAGIAVYHLAIAPRAGTTSPGAGDGVATEGIEEIRREWSAFRRSAGGAPGAGAPSADVAALSARLQALEQRVIGPSVEAGANQGRLPAGVGSRSWTDDQLASQRSMMDEIDARRTADRETASYRDLVRRVAPTLSAADEATSVSLVTAFLRRIRELFAGGSAGNTEEERVATLKKAAAEREKLLADLRTILPGDVVERLGQHIPDFSAPLGQIPPNKVEPTAGMEPK